jgi:hypothetical protein
MRGVREGLRKRYSIDIAWLRRRIEHTLQKAS